MKVRFVSVAALVMSLLGATPVAATEQAVSDLVLIREGDVIDDDLLAGGTIVRVLGVVEGDLVAAAFDVIEIEGVVEGDLLALAPTVILKGQVMGSVRVLGGTIVVGGDVGEDLLVAGGTLDVEGDVGGDLLAVTLSTNVSGSLGDDLTIQTVRGSFDGRVGGDIDGAVRSGVLGNGAVVGGDVSVRGTIDVSGGAQVAGSVRDPATRPLPLQARAYVVLGALMGLSVWLLAGPFVRWLAPGWLEQRLGGAHPGRWLSSGIGTLLTGVLFVGALVLLASASPSEAGAFLAIIAALIALAMVVVLACLALVGTVPLTMAVGARVGSPRTPMSAHVRGVVVVFVASLLPWIGGVVGLGFSLAAVGAVLPQAWGSGGRPVTGPEGGGPGDPLEEE